MDDLGSEIFTAIAIDRVLVTWLRFKYAAYLFESGNEALPPPCDRSQLGKPKL